MEKVKLPREVAEALDASKHMGAVAIMAHLARFGDYFEMTTTRELSLVHSYYKENPYLIASALINGYEVEQTPEERVKELFDLYNSQTDLGRASRDAIKAVLINLGIEIEGVNA